MEEVEEADDAEHGGGDVAGVHEEGEDLGEGGGVAGDEPGAEGDVEEGIAFEEELGAGEEGSVEGGDLLEGAAEAGVGVAKGAAGAGLAGEALDFADALDGVLDVGGEGGGFVAVLAPDLVDAFLEAAGEEEDEGDGNEGEGREGGVNPEHEGEGADEGQGDFEKGFGEEVGGGADHAEVGGDAAEDLAGLGAVEEGEGEALEMVEEVRAQGGLDAESQPLPANGAAPFQRGRAHGQERKEQRAPTGLMQIPRRQADLEDVEGDGRNEQAGPRPRDHRRQVQRQELPLRAIVTANRPQPLEHSLHAWPFLLNWRAIIAYLCAICLPNLISFMSGRFTFSYITYWYQS